MKQITEAFGQRLQESGITRIQWIALYYLGMNVSLSQRELANLMNITDSSAGRLIDRMERDGYVERQRSKSDRRVVKVALTPVGESYRDQLMPLGQAFNDELIQGLTESELIVFEKVLLTMVKNVVNMESQEKSNQD